MEDPESFTVRIVSTCGMNIARPSGTVEIVDNALVVTNADIVCADAAAAVRLDQRTTLGGRLVCGVEKYGTSTGGVATVWDTTTVADRWMEIADDVVDAVAVLVRNDAGVRIEEGRLTSDATWTADAVHVVRNWVVVPRGVTLAVAEGAIVKFTEDTGIRIEDGGQVVAAGMNIESASAEVAIIDNAIESGHAPGLGAVEPWTTDIVTNDVLHDAQFVVTVSTTWNDTDVAASFARLRLIPEADPTVTNELYSIAAPATASYALDAAKYDVGLYRLVHEVCDVYGDVLSHFESMIRIFDDPNVMRVIMPEGVTNFSDVVWVTEKPEGLDDEYAWLYKPGGTLVVSNVASTRLIFDRNAWIGKLKIVNAPGAVLTIDVSSFSRAWPSQLDFSGAQGGVVFDVDYRQLASEAVAGAPSTNCLWNSFTNLVAVVGTENVRAPGLPNGYSCDLDVVPFSFDTYMNFGLWMSVTAPDAAQTPGEIVETDIQTMTRNARGENVLRIVQEGRARDLTVAGDWTNHLAGLTVDASMFGATGGNGIPVWQSYVLGVDPFEEKPVNGQIVATITMNDDGTPVVRCEPDMSGDDNRSPFVTYETLGRQTLGEGEAWHTAASGDRFFKVKVEIR